MKLSIQNIVYDRFLLKNPRNIFRSCDICCTDQDRLPHIMIKLNIIFHKSPLSWLIIIDLIIHIYSKHLPIRWDNHYLEIIDLTKLFSLSRGSSSHTRKLCILLKEILISNSRHSLRFSLNLNSFLSLNRLMKPLRESSTRHSTSSMLIYDQNLTIGNNIILISDIYSLCLKSVFNMVNFLISHILIDIFNLQKFLKSSNTSSRKLSSLGLFIDIVISIFFLWLPSIISQNFLNKPFWNLLFLRTWCQKVYHLCIISIFFCWFFSWLRND